MTPNLLLSFLMFMLFIQVPVSLGKWQHVTVVEGETLTLNCPVSQAHNRHVEWKNPKGYLMFFNGNRVLNDKRYNIDNLSMTEFTVSVSNVSFKDGGNYTCNQYKQAHIERIVEVTVLGQPKLDAIKHARKWILKCTAEGNHYPPQIHWGLGNGIEVAGKPYHQFESGTRKYLTVDTIQIRTLKKRAEVKCLVYHPAWHAEPLIDFVIIGEDSKKFPQAASNRFATTTPRRRTVTLPTPTQRPSTKGTTETSTTSHFYWPSSEDLIELSTKSSNGPVNVMSSTRKHLGTTNESVSSMSASLGTRTETRGDRQNTTGQSLVSESVVTDVNTSNNETEGNSTRGTSDAPKQRTRKETDSLLVLLVTCLILSLLVVVIFLIITLRKAQIRWKRENEESDQSVESSKSKSSSEERQSQRHKGVFNKAFTQYVAEEPEDTSTATNATATEISQNAAPQPCIASAIDGLASIQIKETEL